MMGFELSHYRATVQGVAMCYINKPQFACTLGTKGYSGFLPVREVTSTAYIEKCFLNKLMIVCTRCCTAT